MNQLHPYLKENYIKYELKIKIRYIIFLSKNEPVFSFAVLPSDFIKFP